MRKYFLFLILFVALISCDKNDNNPDPTTPITCPPEPLATFKYKSNGDLVEFSGSLLENSREGVLIRKMQRVDNLPLGTELSNTNYEYGLFATKNFFYGDHGETLVIIRINTTSLTTKTYTQATDELHALFFLPRKSTNDGLPSRTNFTVTITKVENGYASGTFTGKLYQNSSPNTYEQITDGEFSNVKILQ